MKKHILLTLWAICITALTYAQTATKPSGNGSEASPYQIASLENLYWLSQSSDIWLSSLHFEQTADIDATDTRNWDSGNGFSPIGNSDTGFRGYYNGNGYTIDNLYISKSSTNYSGLFGFAIQTVIENLGVTNVTIYGSNYTGALAGTIYSECTITNCYSTGNIYINSDASSIGGLVGHCSGIVFSNSFSSCNVVSAVEPYMVGGLIGTTGNITLSNSYALGNVSGDNDVGGLIGRISYASGATITNCYATGKITITGSGYTNEAGGILSNSYSSTFSDSGCFWDTETTETTRSLAGAGKTSEEMQDYSLFFNAGWDFINETDNGSDDIWGFNQNQNGGYPFLAWQDYTHNPAPILDSISDLELTTAVANLRIHTNVTAYGVCWNTTGNPTINDDHTNEGSISSIGNYTSQLTNLERDKIYYVRAYSINGTDTTYSSALSFKSAHSPEITTLDVNNINEFSATGNIHVANLGVPYLTACGVCWNTSGSPTIEDNYTDLGAVSDTGYYAVQMSGLTHYSQYYVRAFAINKMDTIYGSETSFTALNADFVASATILEFGDIPIGNLVSQKISVSNTGDINLDISEIIMPANYNISPLVGSIVPGGSLEFDLTYFPKTSGSFSDSIIFISNAGSDTIYVNGASSYQAAPDAGNAIEFNGSNDYIDLGSPDALDSLAMGNFSIEMWINTSDISTRSILIGNYNGNPSINLELHTDYGGGVLKTYLDGTGFTGTQSVADGKWHHIATVVDFDNDFVKMYIDGINSYSGTGLPEKYTVNRNMMIGRDPRDGSHYYNGQMDEVRIWNKALSQEEIRAHYGSIPGNSEGLVAYYRFDEADGDGIYDQTGNGSSGTLMETPTRIIPSTAPVADPVLDIETNSLSFGSLFSGENNTIPLKVKNAGGGILHIESLGFDTDNFVITPETANLFSEDSIEMQVVFQPGTTGDLSGNLIFDHNMGFDTVEMEAYCVVLPHITSFSLDGTTANVASLNFAVDDLGSPAPEYGICWNTTGTPTLNDSYTSYGTVPFAGSFNFQITGLSAATNYIARAYMINGTIITYSDEVSFTTAKVTPVISWAIPSDITYGTALSATQLNATADVPGTFEYSPVAGTMLDAGNNQELSVTFTPDNPDTIYVANATVNINVSKANLTVTPENATRTYGESNPEFAVTYSGFVNSETSDVLDTKPTASSEATPTSNVDTYDIIVSGGNDNNYNFTYQTGTLTVEKAELTVTADDATRTYGESNPEFTLSYSGFANDETSDVLNTKPTASSEATVSSDVNTYDIVVSGGDDNNYDFTYQAGTLTVEKAELTVTADDATRTYGESNPEFTFTYSGFVNDENASVLDTEPTVSTEATITSDVNAYDIVVSGGNDNNYSYSFTNGTLSIASRTLTLSNFIADSKSYDGTSTVTGTGFDDDRVSGDELTFTYNAVFEDKNAGTGKTVNYSDIAISGGTDAGNYTLATSTGSAKADISARILTISNFIADSKTYDGTSTVTGAGFNDDRIPGDDLMFSYNAAFEDKNAGTGKTVNYSDIAISGGTDAGNYTLAASTGSATADILAKALTITANNQLKTVGQVFSFDGTEFTSEGLVSGDEITSATLSSDGASSDATLRDYDIIISNAIGSGLENYDITYQKGIMSVINQIIPEISWSNPSDITYGTALSSEQLNATTVTAGTFTYTPSEGTILSVGEGQILSVVFTPDDTDNYTENSKSVSINITKADLTVTAEDANRNYGESNPEFTFTYNGFVNNEDASVLDTKPTASSEATATSDANTYDIIVSGGDDNNYDFTYETGTLIVEKADLTVTADDASRTYGESNPEFTFTYNGFVNDENSSVLDTEPTVSTEATATSDVNTYDIVVSGGNDNNYSFTYQIGTLTVEKANLTVTAEDATRTYGESNPEFTFTYNGFVNDENSSVLDTEPTVSTEATATSDVNTYDIVVSGGNDNNYSFTYQTGTLTLNKANLAVGVEDNTIVEEEDIPEFTITYSGFINDENESVLDEVPTATCNATTTSIAGTYEIVVSGGVDNNYEFSYTNGVLTITPLTGIEDLRELNITVYPNPTSEFVNISLEEIEGIITYNLLSVTGRMISVGVIDEGLTSIDMSQLEVGLYVLRLVQGDKVMNYKIVKE